MATRPPPPLPIGSPKSSPSTPSPPRRPWPSGPISGARKARRISGAHCPSWKSCRAKAAPPARLHGALQAGAFATTFTASQGLLLMIPNMYKIAGELTPATMHVTARTLATHALSIFGDHSDVMACRSTGWAMLASNSVQEVADLALVAQIATLESRIPFIHFFDGFRTSHEVGKILPISDETIRAILDDKYIIQFRQNALSPDRPIIRGTAQNPDVFFQAREACTPFHAAVPGIVQSVMNRFAALTGRALSPLRLLRCPRCRARHHHHGLRRRGRRRSRRSPLTSKAKSSACSRSASIAPSMPAPSSPRCPRPSSPSPFSIAARSPAPPASRSIRTSSPFSPRTPQRCPSPRRPQSSAAATASPRRNSRPPWSRASSTSSPRPTPKNHFTIGIDDDVSHTSLTYDPAFSTEDPKTVRALFYGLGSDGTVGANKNSIKIIGTETPNYAQGYFVYDSKKSGSMTTSHLRFGPNPIRSTYLITRASFVACHNFSFLEKMNVLESSHARRGLPAQLALLRPPKSGTSCPRRTQQEMLAQEDRVLRHRRLQSGARCRHGHAHQHHHADLLLRHQRRAAARRSHRADQEGHQEDLRQARRSRRAEELRRRRSRARASRQSRAAHRRLFELRPHPIHLRQGSGVCSQRARQNRRRPGRSASRQRHSRRRRIPHRHRAVGEAQHRAVHPRVGQGPLHPVRQVRHGLPARRDSRQGLQSRSRRQGSRDLPVGQAQVEGHGAGSLHAAGRSRRLHRLRASAWKSAR